MQVWNIGGFYFCSCKSRPPNRQIFLLYGICSSLSVLGTNYRLPRFCTAVNTSWMVQLEREQSVFVAVRSARYSRPGVRLSVILVSVVVTGGIIPSSNGFPSVGMRLILYEMLLTAQTPGGRFQLICTVPFAVNDTRILLDIEAVEERTILLLSNIGIAERDWVGAKCLFLESLKLMV